MADGWEAFPEAGGGKPDPWAAFPPDVVAATGDQPARITVSPFTTKLGTGSRADAALNIPEAYGQIVRSGLNTMGEGASQVGEGASGVFSNRDADRSPRGPIPISSRLKSVGDILGGVLKTAGGTVDYLTAPIMAPVRAIASQPAENVLGIPREYSEFAAGLALPVPAKSPVSLPSRAPTVAELGQESTALRNAPEITGTVLEPAARSGLATAIDTELARARVSDRSAETIRGIVAGFEKKTGAPSVEDIDALRKHISEMQPIKDGTGKVTNLPELRAAEIARKTLDDYLPTAPTLFGDASKAAETLAETRANESAKFAAETINRKAFKAELQAARANSGQNVTNTMRNQISQILLDPAQRRGFSRAELMLMEDIVRGTKAENQVRGAGNILGGGGGVGMLHSGSVGGILGGLVGGPAGAAIGAATFPAIGYGLKKLGNAMTARNIDRLNEMVRADSPLGRKMGAPVENWSNAAQAFGVSPTARNVARLSLASRNLSNNLRDVGINVSADDLTKAGSSGADSQENE